MKTFPYVTFQLLYLVGNFNKYLGCRFSGKLPFEFFISVSKALVLLKGTTTFIMIFVINWVCIQHEINQCRVQWKLSWVFNSKIPSKSSLIFQDTPSQSNSCLGSDRNVWQYWNPFHRKPTGSLCLLAVRSKLCKARVPAQAMFQWRVS